MDGGLRQRAIAGSGNSPKQPVQQDISAAAGVSESKTPRALAVTQSLARKPIWVYLSLLLHLCAVGLYLAGFIWRISFHTGEECDMTYSHRAFLEIQTDDFGSDSKAADFYKLYKFVDVRDPRYQRLLSDPQPLKGNSHCGPRPENSVIVLYIPGHWGSYGQARSVGAHGTTMTGAREDPRQAQRALLDGKWHGMADRLDEFVYEVYAVDFAEQGGALHGRFLELQSDFVAYAVERLVNSCQVDTVTIVAHSMGGYVARLTPIRHVKTQQWLPDIITLATPHSNPLYAFERSMHNIHQQMQSQYHDESVLISISGGFRDDMIEPTACQTGHSSSQSYLSTDFLERGLLGMDHRAVVWCNGVLEEVRKAIWTLVKNNDDGAQERLNRVAKVLGSKSYKIAVTNMLSNFYSEYGIVKAVAIESAMLYNLPILYGLYAIVAGFACVLPNSKYGSAFWITPFLCGLLWPDQSIPCFLILSLVANSIRLILFWCTPVGFLHSKGPLKVVVATFVAVGVLLVLVGLAGTYWILQHWTLDHFGCIAYFSGIIAINLSCFFMVGFDDRSSATLAVNGDKVAFALLIVSTIPGMFAGAVVLLVWEQRVLYDSWWLLFSIMVPVCSVCLFKGTRSSNSTIQEGNLELTERRKRWRGLAVGIAIVVVGPRLPARGNAYLVVSFVRTISCAEMAMELLTRMLQKPRQTSQEHRKLASVAKM